MGITFNKVRKNKNLKIKDITSSRLSRSQISHIENGKSIPSAEKFLYLLNVLNVKYEEFIYLMNEDYLVSKNTLGNKMSEVCNLYNTEGIQSVIDEAIQLYLETNDIYFKHIEIIAKSFLMITESIDNLEAARVNLIPIQRYLANVENYGFYEFALFNNALFIFDIDVAVSLGEKVMKSKLSYL